MAEYIDRKALEKAMTIAAANGKDKDRRTWAKAICVLHDMPTEDVAPAVHGRWEQCFEDWRKQIEGDKCSICGFEHYGASIAHYHFCPNCGAKMGGEAEELPHE